MSGQYTDEQAGIQRRLEAAWVKAGTPAELLTPIFYWGENYPADDSDARRNQDQIKVSITEDNDPQQITLGDPPQLVRYQNQLIVQILIPEDTGNRANAYAEKLNTIFQRAQFSYGDSGKMTFRIPGKRTIGVVNAYFQVNWSCFYQRDKIQ